MNTIWKYPDRDELRDSRFQPAGLGHGHTLGAVPVAAGVVDRPFIATPVTTLDMSSLKLGTASDDGGHDPFMSSGIE